MTKLSKIWQARSPRPKLRLPGSRFRRRLAIRRSLTAKRSSEPDTLWCWALFGLRFKWLQVFRIPATPSLAKLADLMVMVFATV